MTSPSQFVASASPPGAAITTLNIGDTVPIGTALVNLILMGLVTDVNTPNMFAATMQAFKSKALLTVPVLQGDTGPAGQPTFALRFQNNVLPSPDDLPTDLTDLESDLGKYWVFAVTDNNGNVIATTMQVWYGTEIGWREFPVGTPGPPGPYPLITPIIVPMAPGNGMGPNGVDSWIQVSGSVSNPTFTFYVAAPQGIPGPTAMLSACPDVDLITNPPQTQQALVCTSRIVPGAPTGLQVNPSSSGGSLAAGSWFWALTSVLPNGTETMASNEVSAQVVGSTSSALLTWIPPAGGGSIGSKLYRGNSATNLSVLVAEITGGATASYLDTGQPGTPASPPSVGVVEGRPIWAPATISPVLPLLYTVPESAFTSISGIGAATQTVCTFAVPPQPFAWKPVVFASMQIFGIDISFTPLLVGAQVMLGDPTAGVVVAQGSGNSIGYVTLIPAPATDSAPSRAITPTNNVGLVPAHHSGSKGTLYVSLVNHGMVATYDFNSSGASMMVLVVPVPGSLSVVSS